MIVFFFAFVRNLFIVELFVGVDVEVVAWYVRW